MIASTASPQRTPRYAWYALAVLFVVYTLNFLDRALINILFPPIKKEMALTDLELALLGSTSFVIFYTLLGIPFGRLADRVVRKRLIAVGLLLWCLFSGLTGFMHSFRGLFLCRVMVGVGEATLGPAALSLLSDYFPRERRGTVGAIYSAGIPCGAGLALFLGGTIGHQHGWRWAFYLLGFPGLLLTVVVLALREPLRGSSEGAAILPETEHIPADWRVLFRTPALWCHYLGYACLAVAANSLNMWLPTYLTKVFHLNLEQAGRGLGLMTMTGGLLGVVAGGLVADLLRRRWRGGRMLTTSIAALLCAPLWLLLLRADALWGVLVPCFFLSGLGLMWLGPAAADVHDLVGPRLRGLGTGVYFFIVNVIGYGIGAPVFGKLNDYLGTAQHPERMRQSLLLSPVMCLLSAALLYSGSRLMERSPLTAADRHR